MTENDTLHTLTVMQMKHTFDKKLIWEAITGIYMRTNFLTIFFFTVGDVVGVYNDFSTDSTPIEPGRSRCTFSGFRIAPQ